MIKCKLIRGDYGDRWYHKYRVNIGSWHGTPPKGKTIIDNMRELDLSTGIISLIAPKNKLF